MTSIDTNHRAIAVAATALTITAITARAVSARPSQSPHQLLHVSPAASTPASRARAASVLRRASHDANADPQGVPITPVGISTLPRAIVNVEKPVAPAASSVSWKLRKVGRTGLIVRHGTYDPPPARSRHTSTHKFSSDGKDHIPAGDLHSDGAGIHRPRPPRLGHMGAQALGGGIGAAGSALTVPAAKTLSSPPAISAPLKSGPARAAAPAAPPTPPSKTPLGVSAPANAGRGPSEVAAACGSLLEEALPIGIQPPHRPLAQLYQVSRIAPSLPRQNASNTVCPDRGTSAAESSSRPPRPVGFTRTGSGPQQAPPVARL
jgi:hypothetical protein